MSVYFLFSAIQHSLHGQECHGTTTFKSHKLFASVITQSKMTKVPGTEFNIADRAGTVHRHSHSDKDESLRRSSRTPPYSVKCTFEREIVLYSEMFSIDYQLRYFLRRSWFYSLKLFRFSLNVDVFSEFSRLPVVSGVKWCKPPFVQEYRKSLCFLYIAQKCV